ncbi:MAG: hypothetical protein QOI10_4394 [Solirubrobacterales bacterium]|jgi:hypothetical protein|nr:hypothetical protein [Solirubrobacterales bacterium]
MQTDGPTTCLAALRANSDVTGKHLDLNQTYTNEFIQAAQPRRATNLGPRGTRRSCQP